jgi:8-oxo-dGTP diphosphatase
MPDRAGVIAAGAVVVRRSGSEVLLVHRPKYDDWSFPKGKQDPGEHVTATAVREVREETGLDIVLGRPLPPQLYAVSGGRAKTVHYWSGRVRGDDDVSGWIANDEIDAVRWVPRDEASRILSYLDDIQLLGTFAEHPRRTSALVVVRHAEAQPRKTWTGPDPLRPLTSYGEAQATALAPVLAAYGVRRLVSSPSTRCTETLTPAARRGPGIETVAALSEEDFARAGVRPVVDDLLAHRRPAALCTHRPVLRAVLEMLGVTEEPLAPGEAVVCHHRKGRVVATERHLMNHVDG